MDAMMWALAIAIGYALGAIPFGVLLSRGFGLGDVRNIGSGNIGATNVLRTGRKDIALATLLLDAGKAAAAYWVVLHFIAAGDPKPAMAAAFFALIGHCYPIWLRFKGGKGVATFFGGLLIVNWILALCIGVIWVVIAFATRTSSLAALIAVNGAPVLALALGLPDLAAYAGMMALIISLRHVDNIRRLWHGKEPTFGKKGGK